MLSNREGPSSGQKKKDSGALSAQRSLRKILGGGLLSHMKICSIIGDKELNFRVRNGIGCTLFSMATKKFGGIYIEREEGSSDSNIRRTGY